MVCILMALVQAAFQAKASSAISSPANGKTGQNPFSASNPAKPKERRRLRRRTAAPDVSASRERVRLWTARSARFIVPLRASTQCRSGYGSNTAAARGRSSRQPTRRRAGASSRRQRQRLHVVLRTSGNPHSTQFAIQPACGSRPAAAMAAASAARGSAQPSACRRRAGPAGRAPARGRHRQSKRYHRVSASGVEPAARAFDDYDSPPPRRCAAYGCEYRREFERRTSARRAARCGDIGSRGTRDSPARTAGRRWPRPPAAARPRCAARPASLGAGRDGLHDADADAGRRQVRTSATATRSCRRRCRCRRRTRCAPRGGFIALIRLPRSRRRRLSSGTASLGRDGDAPVAVAVAAADQAVRRPLRRSPAGRRAPRSVSYAAAIAASRRGPVSPRGRPALTLCAPMRLELRISARTSA
jgi:hypothetical protein